MQGNEEYSLLIVDDNEMNRDILHRHLKKQGFVKIISAENGREALELILQSTFDLVLLDIMMPEVNGYEVLSYIKSNSSLSQIPVIVISALSEIDSIVKCIEMGAEDYLSKPFDPVLLKARTGACLEKKRLRDRESHYRRQLEETNQKLKESNRHLEDSKRKLEETNRKLAHANEKLEELTRLDGLTGIANRRHFDYVLKQEWKVAARNVEQFSLVLFDIDFFKQYNDTYGHLAGDDCLRRVAHLSKQSIKRPRDIVARYGGEEFAIVLPDTDALGAEMLGKRICVGTENLAIPHERSGVSPYVTVSVGIATTLASHINSPDSLIARADEALFQAKARGRNCFHIWKGESIVV